MRAWSIAEASRRDGGSPARFGATDRELLAPTLLGQAIGAHDAHGFSVAAFTGVVFQRA